MDDVKKYDRVQMPMSVPDKDKPYLFPGVQLPQAHALTFLDDSDSDQSDGEVGEGDYDIRSELSEDNSAEDTTMESTDTEMQHHTQTMLISSDGEKDCLVVLSRRHDRVVDEATRRVWEEYVEEDTSAHA